MHFKLHRHSSVQVELSVERKSQQVVQVGGQVSQLKICRERGLLALENSGSALDRRHLQGIAITHVVFGRTAVHGFRKYLYYWAIQHFLKE